MSVPVHHRHLLLLLAVDERVGHGVGHAEEEDPQYVALIDVAHVGERVHDEDDLVI